ncbi:MAG: Fic family protein [Armatimonadetes bacterium]|nr:Fic family protein [Armatimonadota bacterium]
MAFDPARPYNDLPLLPPAVELETRALLKQAIAARANLGELKGFGTLLPDQAILTSALLLMEARASSEIENIVTTNDELYRATGPDDPRATPQAKEVLRYREALWSGFQEIDRRPLCTNLFIDIVAAIRGVDVGIRRVPGTHIANSRGEVLYTPPEGERVIRDKLANLETFLHAEDGLDPLVKLAVMHYQFEAIHPFTDGNGRTGRILNVLYLVSCGLLEQPVLYLSGYILEHRSEYYRCLRRVTEEGAWEDWLLYMLTAVEETALRTLAKVAAVREQMEIAQRLVRQEAQGIYSKDLIEAVFRQPYCRIRTLEETLGVSHRTAITYLQIWTRLGVFSVVRMGRDSLYVNDGLVRALTG